MAQLIDLRGQDQRSIVSNLAKGLKNIATYKTAVDIGQAVARYRARVKGRNATPELIDGIMRVMESDGHVRFLKNGNVEVSNRGYVIQVAKDHRMIVELLNRAGFYGSGQTPEETPEEIRGRLLKESGYESPHPEPQPIPLIVETVDGFEAQDDDRPHEVKEEEVKDGPSGGEALGPKGQRIPEWILEKYKIHTEAFETVVLRLGDSGKPYSRIDLFHGTGFEDAGKSRAFLKALESGGMIEITGDRRGTRYAGVRPAIDEALNLETLLRFVVTSADKAAWDAESEAGEEAAGPAQDQPTDEVSEEPESAHTGEPEDEEVPQGTEESHPQEGEESLHDQVAAMAATISQQNEVVATLLRRERSLRDRVESLERKFGELMAAVRGEK
jgi:hypothetical protein